MGHRDKAIIETLYGCGLRVSELVGLNISEIYFQEEFIKVHGKGNKERLVPIAKSVLKVLGIYINESRVHLKVNKKYTDTNNKPKGDNSWYSFIHKIIISKLNVK